MLEPYLVVAGVIIHGDRQLRLVRKRLDELVDNHIPAEFRDGFVFHATEVFNGGGPGTVFDRKRPGYEKSWPWERRFAIAHDICQIIQVFELPLALGMIERAKFPQTFKFADKTPRRKELAVQQGCAFMGCAMEVDLWMRSHTEDEHCMMIVEDNDNARGMIRDFQREHQNPKLVESLSEKERQYFPFRTIIEDPCFQAKRKSSALQISDFCAYVTKRLVRGELSDKRYLRLWGNFRGQLIRPFEAQTKITYTMDFDGV
jgi:hypothetical protein